MTGVITLPPYALLPYTGTILPYCYQQHATCVIRPNIGLLLDVLPCFGVSLHHPQGRLPYTTIIKYSWLHCIVGILWLLQTTILKHNSWKLYCYIIVSPHFNFCSLHNSTFFVILLHLWAYKVSAVVIVKNTMENHFVVVC
jgi:hypothetical protein